MAALFLWSILSDNQSLSFNSVFPFKPRVGNCIQMKNQ
jgi:hypothetical protein